MVVSLVDACKCNINHPQERYCNADFGKKTFLFDSFFFYSHSLECGKYLLIKFEQLYCDLLLETRCMLLVTSVILCLTFATARWKLF